MTRNDPQTFVIPSRTPVPTHTPFGESLIHPDATDDQGDYTGHIRDRQTGLSYMQARYQDPLIGRFLSIDPVTFMDTGNPAMFNRYAYCYDDPVNCTDPDGEFGLVGAAFGAVAGGVGGYISTGSLRGTLAGAAAGGAVGFVAPHLAASAGSGVAIAYAGTVAATASVAGQLTGQVAENVSNGAPAAPNLSIDLVATGVAAATGPAAGSVNGTVANVGAKTSYGMPHVNSTSALGAKIVDKNKASMVFGAAAEGGLIGGAEKLGDIAGSIGESLTGIPTNLSLTNSSGGFEPELITNREVEERR